jgi:protein ImuB
MGKRYVAIWFRHLKTDWMARRNAALKDTPFVLAAPERGRMVIKAANEPAEAKGIYAGMVVADCRAIFPDLLVLDDDAKQSAKLLHALAEWCLRYTPSVSLDMPDGLVLDASGCAHLWGGEQAYLHDLLKKLRAFDYDAQAAMADTVGAAWAVARYGKSAAIIEPGRHVEALLSLPSAALRIDSITLERLEKLGLYQVHHFIHMPRKALRRRFGQHLLTKIDQATGQEMEILSPIKPVESYLERLPCLEPIQTATGIEIAIKQLLSKLCARLAKEEKGMRRCVFKAYRIDGVVQQIEIGTNRPSRNEPHLFKLLELKIAHIEPALGIEVFTLEAPIVEDMVAGQDAIWDFTEGGNGTAIGELLDRIAGKLGMHTIHRYLPDEHYWPERSYKAATSLTDKPHTHWRTDLPRPLHLLPQPETIEVTVPLPDYPPMLFRHKGVLHQVRKADGPERIEQEWWLEQGLYRDYYRVEDEHGGRYWLYRQGDYESGAPQWFLHGFFA